MVGWRVLALSVAAWAIAVPALAGTDLRDLISDPVQYDGQPVTITGEVTGEVAVVGTEKRVWVQAGPLVVTVWAPAAIMGPIRHIGRKFITGDTIRVSGVFHQADSAHGGETVILATRIALVAPGGELRPEYETRRAQITAIAWFVAGAAIGVWHWRRRRREPR